MKREYGIDLIRVFGMMLVIIGHIVGMGGVVEATEIGTSQHHMTVFLQVFSMCSINIFGLISGYVCFGKRMRIRPLIKLWLRVIFWTVSITLIFASFGWISVDGETIRKTFLPVISQTYWYITAYFVVALISPLSNFFIERIDGRILFIVILGGVVLLSVIITTSGNNAIWLLLLYIIGATIKKTKILQNRQFWIGILGFGICITSTFIANILQENSVVIWNKTLWAIWGGRSDGLWPSSLSMLVAAVFVLLFGINVKTYQMEEALLKNITPLILSVYLIHVHPLVFNAFKGKLSFLANCFFAVEGTLVVLLALLIMVVCMILDWGREKLFQFGECYIDRMQNKRKKEEYK